MKQLTIRGFGRELALRLQRMAEREGVSLNQAALRLMRKGAGLDDERPVADVVGSSLDHLIGTWSAEEAAGVDRAIADFEQIDESMWE